MYVLIGILLIAGLLGGGSLYVSHLRLKGASNFVKKLQPTLLSSQLIAPQSKENPFRIPRIKGNYKEAFKISYSVKVSNPTDGKSSASGNATYNRQKPAKDRGSFTYIEIEGEKIFGIDKLYIASKEEAENSHVAGAEIIESYEESPLNKYCLWSDAPLLAHAIFEDTALSQQISDLLNHFPASLYIHQDTAKLTIYQYFYNEQQLKEVQGLFTQICAILEQVAEKQKALFRAL